MRWKDINLEARTLSVAQTLERVKAGIAFKEPKSQRSRRTVSLPQVTVEALRRAKLRQAEELLAIGVRQTRETLVSGWADRGPLDPEYVTHAFARLVSRLGLAARFHDLRHSHISHLLAAGVHPKVASERAGHASVSITLDTYSHLMPGMQEDAANRIDAALRKHLEG